MTTESKLNDNWQERDKLLFGDATKERYRLGGIAHFEDVSVLTLKRLLELGYADAEDAQNDAPTYEQFLEFMDAHPKCKAHGYAVSPDRDDYRISIEGVGMRGRVTRAMLQNFTDFARHADEFYADSKGLYCWWD
jgi:hypothetical protein